LLSPFVWETGNEKNENYICTVLFYCCGSQLLTWHLSSMVYSCPVNDHELQLKTALKLLRFNERGSTISQCPQKTAVSSGGLPQFSLKSTSSGLWRRIVLWQDIKVSEVHGGSMDLWNAGILPQHYTTSQSTRLDMKHHSRESLKTCPKFLSETFVATWRWNETVVIS